MDFLEYVDSSDSKAALQSKIKIGLIVFVVCIVLGTVSYFAFFGTDQGGLEVTKTNLVSESPASQESTELTEGAATDSGQICVDVAGAVNSPGVVYISAEARVADAIAAAGGARDDAVLSQINQARIVSDGEQIYVPSTSEAASSVSGSIAQASTEASTNNGKININTADSALLQTISGIGEAKAEKIIAYRSANGNFKSIDELVNVSGIGEKTLESIRDQICV